LSPEELKAIEQTVAAFLSRFSRVHAAAIARNPKAVRHRLIRLISSHFQLKRGRKPDSTIVEAYRMLQQGVKRRELIRVLFPGFDALDPYVQHLARKGFYSKLKRCELRDHKKPSKTQSLKTPRNS
jgi:hypothetical protein